MKKIVIASSNKGKIQEIKQYFQDDSIEWITQDQLNISCVEETATTFVENALLKAKHICHYTQLPVLADDSGLVIAVLKGYPGIISARYAGKNANSNANIEKVLHQLSAYPKPEQRQAYFYCSLVLLKYNRDPSPLISTGIWHGRILTKPQGSQGFGYDPIFYCLQSQCSAAELKPEEKNRLSHRGRALIQLKNQMYELFS